MKNLDLIFLFRGHAILARGTTLMDKAKVLYHGKLVCEASALHLNLLKLCHKREPRHL